MADINQQFINEIANNMLKPTIVDTMVFNGSDSAGYFNDLPAKYTLKFIGYALPSCTGMDDPKWLIQLNVKVDIDSDEGTTVEGSPSGINLIVEDMPFQQRSMIGFANGVRNFDQRWNERMKLAYKIAKGSEPFYQDGVLLNEIFSQGELPEYDLPSGGGGNEQEM